ncbi:hypothetical protein FOA43_000433 [Brettanomyces nanus]|uniref:Protein kinase domain-containing protein n=1 Tax=Eeniella nana TaxID=13502 RepID=A0A875RX26_EENNA|nr:uncharacterized protein FOA43_000433 [Brettanomyces nanus]QPG73128.1 hypothetical protein FOA43_000433 [Brettanomyces nanus]
MSLDYQRFLNGGLLHNRYTRVEGLNEGSFGIVSLAKDALNGSKLVALKYNTGELEDFEAFEQKEAKTTYANAKIEHPDVDKSFVLSETTREVKMLRKAGRHPNIAQLLDNFDTYIVLEYVSRGDLHDAIQLGIAPVSTRDVVDVFMQLISAVEHCHNLGIYHRDIKPENILIAEDWSIKLTDFGLATDHLWSTDFDVGSERYMAPELLEHNDIDSYRADKVDVWSMGICLLNIVFGKSPFKSASSGDKMFLYFAANRETLFDIFPSMSYDLFGVMRHSLTIDPENRDLQQMKESLSKVDVLTYDYEFEEEEEEATFDLPELAAEPATPEIIPTPIKISGKPEDDTLGKYILKPYSGENALAMDFHGVNKVPERPVQTSVPVTASQIYTVPKGKHRFPHHRKPLNIPAGTRHRNRSQKGRVNKETYTESELNGSFLREDYFTPRSVFNHYMEKTNQHRKFDHRAREQQQQQQHRYDYHEDRHSGRAWRQRKNQRSYAFNKYRSGNRVNGRKPYFNSGRNYLYARNNARSSSFQDDRNNGGIARSIPISQSSNTARCAYKPRTLQNLSSPSGKYIPPNMRSRPLSPGLPPVMGPELELAPPLEGATEDDEMFMFEDAGARKETKVEDNSQQISALSRKFRDCTLNVTSTVPELSLSAPQEKYVPPHHRRKSSYSSKSRPIFLCPKKYNIPHNNVTPMTAAAAKSEDRVISSSVPAKNTNWFMQHYQPHKDKSTIMTGDRSNWYDYDDQDLEDYVSEGFGLSYVNGENREGRHLQMKDIRGHGKLN